MSTGALQISKEGNSRQQKQQVQSPWGPVNKRVSIGRAAREGPVGLRKDFNIIVRNVGSHRRGVRWLCLSAMIPLASLWVRHGIKVARLLR